ncbi:RsmB/NOP family class I SAM-dependent RNA methyltransferase [Thermogutta sp.]|jgi:16S rRNA (cytosine1407-C5)-methyltransferase|uniref:RsmB/NOP family class I SAM-dependent RNA methyltransferase n=1 Tax=Thermogutta sp. TaxID=1962930 RepID=UPI00321FC912
MCSHTDEGKAAEARTIQIAPRGEALELVARQLPAEFITRLRKILPDSSLSSCLSSFLDPKFVCFRVNTLKTDPQTLEKELGEMAVAFEKVQWLPEAYLAPPSMRDVLTHLPAFAEGRLYIQDLSSMLAVQVLDPQPGEEILDLAAAPGGKTCFIAARMQNRGRIAAVEVVRERMYKLLANVRTAGAQIVEAYLRDGRTVGNKTPNRFDRVMLDAPCSSEARFHLTEPETYARWSLRKIAECSRKQRGLLVSAVKATKPGGLILYCTCSFAPEENEAVVDYALRKLPDELEVAPISLPISNWMPGLLEWEGQRFHPDVSKSVRILPTAEMSGFFLCCLTKRKRSIVARTCESSRRSEKARNRWRFKEPSRKVGDEESC